MQKKTKKQMEMEKIYNELKIKHQKETKTPNRQKRNR